MILTREQRRERNSRTGREGARIRWENYHANLPERVYPPKLPNDCIRISVDDLISGKSHVMLFHPGSRRGRYRIDVDSKFWMETGWSDALARIRKSCKRTPLYIYD